MMFQLQFHRKKKTEKESKVKIKQNKKIKKLIDFDTESTSKHFDAISSSLLLLLYRIFIFYISDT